MAKEIKLCPSCGGSQLKIDGNLVYCQMCDVMYEIKDCGAKVRQADPLKEDRDRLGRIEEDVAAIKKRLGKRLENGESKPDSPDDDDNDEGNGFIELD